MKINTILLGVQKAGTTSLFDWIAQHPEVKGPVHLKDYPFFSRLENYQKGELYLENLFGESVAPINMIGATDYTKDKLTLERIHAYNPEAKVIMVIRNPIDRAVSAFNFMRQLGKENRDNVNTALLDELSNESYSDYDLAYLKRGLYGEQLKWVYEIFNRNQCHIVIFEDMIKDPEYVIQGVYEFLNISIKFKPDFKRENKTGVARFSSINKLFYTDNAVRRSFFQNGLNRFFPPDFRSRMRRKIRSLNTKNDAEIKDLDIEVKNELMRNYFREDFDLLDSLLKKRLSESWLNE